ncbi:hypothetical protein fugu_001379 [Takifugu bimaculatus]|uniref:G-protein coupled receptors family 1 profile domain-containing protein n=1 Tax=Takifugu bimaculatus TaxID=433685 RepID=A0A4Z2CJU0_9TELE|nr:hypothetical protein fugu_001379 [Takifugu bimaculatus]
MAFCNESLLEECAFLETGAEEAAQFFPSEVPPPTISVTLRVTLAAIMIFMITIGFLGNAIVCLIVYQKPAMRSAINLLLATLAFSDIMLSLLCMPFTAVTVASADWSFGSEFCRASIMLYWLFVLEGVSILLIISVDRFLIIVQRQDKLDTSQGEALDRGLLGAEPVRVPALRGWLEEGVGKDRGYLGTTVRARLLRLRGGPWIHSAAGSGGLLCAVRRHALLLPVHSQHGAPQHH